jgi:hypothetical protein
MVRWLGGTNTQLLVTVVVVGVGGLLARRNFDTMRHFPVVARINFAITMIWEACNFLLIWTSLRSNLLLWRASWIALIVVLGSTHLLALRVAASGRSGLVNRLACGSVAVLALMLLYPAVTARFPSLPGTAYLWAIALPAAGTVLGSIAVWRTRADSGRRTGSASSSVGVLGVRWISLSQLALVVIGLCIGRATAPQREALEVRPSSLADLTRQELTTQLDADLERLKILDSEVTDLIRQMESVQGEFDSAVEAEQRDYYLPYEGAQMRSHFRRFLAYRASLLRIVASYAGLDDLPDPRIRARCFTLGLAAAMRTYESSVRIVLMYRNHLLARRALNESQQQHGVDSGMFDWVYESVTSERNVNLASRMADRFTRHRIEWHDAQVWPTSDWDWLDIRIVAALDYVRKHPIDQRPASLDLFLRRLGEQAYAPLYEVQSTLAEWMGDTRMVDQPPAMQAQQIKRIESELRPGDILLERREWYVGNAFLPGFWSHAALYVGRIEDLRRLGIAEHATVQAHLTAYLAPTSDGGDRTVIEALSEGVVFNSLMESLRADHVAVLRPNLSERQIARAMINAFEYYGRPYDFEFDFATADRLVCTEVVYRAYQGMLDFPLVRIMGRNTLPAAEIARKFARERQEPHHELDLLLYYETLLGRTSAQRSTEQAFVATVASSALASGEDSNGGF